MKKKKTYYKQARLNLSLQLCKISKSCSNFLFMSNTRFIKKKLFKTTVQAYCVSAMYLKLMWEFRMAFQQSPVTLFFLHNCDSFVHSRHIVMCVFQSIQTYKSVETVGIVSDGLFLFRFFTWIYYYYLGNRNS